MSASPAVVRACDRIGASDAVPVRCLARVPGPDDSLAVRAGDLVASDRCAYLVEINYREATASGVFHLLFGGRCGRFSLATTAGRWPRDRTLRDDLRLVGASIRRPGGPPTRPVALDVVEDSRWRGRRALMLRARPYPVGGVHGGHFVLLWNDDAGGRVVSAHFREPPATRVAWTLLNVLADSSRAA